MLKICFSKLICIISSQLLPDGWSLYQDFKVSIPNVLNSHCETPVCNLFLCKRLKNAPYLLRSGFSLLNAFSLVEYDFHLFSYCTMILLCFLYIAFSLSVVSVLLFQPCLVLYFNCTICSVLMKSLHGV